tara:strand:+ start:61 stop:315 length:255 start_codon:yes stop_codon:yes gene_type:complete
MISMLIENEADVNKQDNLGLTALMIAAKHGGKNAEEMIQLLLDNKAKIDITDNKNRTAKDYTKNDKIKKLLEEKEEIEENKKKD